MNVNTEQLTDEQVDAAWDEMAAEQSPAELDQVNSQQEEQPNDLNDQANKPDQEDKQPVAQPEQSKEVADPYAGLPEVVKEKLGLVDKLQNDLKASNGRLASIQRDLDVAKQARLKTDDAPTERAIEAAAKKLTIISLFDPLVVSPGANVHTPAGTALRLDGVSLP